MLLTPPGPILDAVPGNDTYTKILLHFDNAWTDSNAGGSAHTWTNNSATFSSSTTKFGGWAGSFAGSQWADTPDSSDFTLGSGDFTLDFWFNVSGSSSGTRMFLCGQIDSGGTTTSASLWVERTTGNVMKAVAAVSSTANAVTGTTAFTAAGWNHLMFIRTGSTLRLFLNGTQEGGDVAISGSVNDSANKWAVGRGGELTTITYTGLLDEFRLSAGIARKTAAFVVPSGPYS